LIVFIHIFGFRWKEHATDAEKERAARDIRAFQGQIPGLIEVSVGENLSPRGQGYTFAGLMKFSDRGSCDAYATHPAHIALLDWLGPLIDPVELDFEA
jgi:hypothetical protein